MTDKPLPFAPPPTPEEEQQYRQRFKEMMGREPQDFEVNAYRVLWQTDSYRRRKLASEKEGFPD